MVFAGEGQREATRQAVRAQLDGEEEEREARRQEEEREARRQAVRAQRDAEQERVRVEYELGLLEDQRYLALEFEQRIQTANERMAMALGVRPPPAHADLPGGYCPCVHTPSTP
jgi:hypothetical protein